ncbi:FAD-dependent oxidoreductase [Oscillatoria salina]|uniref:FAD-dependent oxidoreductase n=1 Tax=Oscillatoria salina TaxID=331517 RepID=UPI001CCB64CE|nr:FAD-dependent oxidoreductase [Oscillatoria salina]MBZ8180887.1 FAD-dependent oxidoreductase [Oscillatoria salina IIICB1]
MISQENTEILVVGGGVGGTVAALQAAHCGINTILVSEEVWLGGMLSSAGVAAPDGNELAAWQTGFWGAYLRQLQHRQQGGLDNAWVSMFTYDPRVGAAIFADWVNQQPNLTWISGETPLEVYQQGNQVLGVRFADWDIRAKIIIDATELGDLLALVGNYRWGWEWQSEFGEPSAPTGLNELTSRYPVQAPTWVVLMQDYGENDRAPVIAASSQDNPEIFAGAWENYGAQKFLDYGRLPGDLLMLNWPISGNDYGVNLGRLVASDAAKEEFLQEAKDYSQSFARFMQNQLGRRYGLAKNVFPQADSGFALHPYYRESRRLQGMVTLTENEILPVAGGRVAALPWTATGEVSAIAIGNYPNDHHYPGVDFPLQPKSLPWGGRITGTPFPIPYGCLVPARVEGLLVAEKNISVSHLANGSTRLQPVVMNIGQAAGMAAALCVKFNCQPQELPVRKLQEALLRSRFAPAAIIPLFNLPPEHPDWLKWQLFYLDNPDAYPLDGNCPHLTQFESPIVTGDRYRGTFVQHNQHEYRLQVRGRSWKLVTLRPEVNKQFLTLASGKLVSLWGNYNPAGDWLVVEKISGL